MIRKWKLQRFEQNILKPSIPGMTKIVPYCGKYRTKVHNVSQHHCLTWHDLKRVPFRSHSHQYVYLHAQHNICLKSIWISTRCTLIFNPTWSVKSYFIEVRFIIRSSDLSSSLIIDIVFSLKIQSLFLSFRNKILTLLTPLKVIQMSTMSTNVYFMDVWLESHPLKSFQGEHKAKI